MFDHFGMLAPVYEKFIKPKRPEKLAELIRLPISGPFLDVGGGTGRVSHFFSEEVGQVFIADLSLKMLAQSFTKNGLIPACSLAENLPFPDDYFERIIMIDALHHVCNHQESANELWRVLKPGERIVIEEPNIQRWGVKLIAVAEKIALMRSHFLKPSKIKDLFDKFQGETSIVCEDHYAWILIDK